MKALKPFEIAFVGLSAGVHEFSFDLNSDFFACFDESEISEPQLEATLVLHKKSNMLDLEFLINGSVRLNCDRCMEPYVQDIDEHQMLYVKFGESFQEQSDDVIIIPSTESHIQMAQYFYEFTVLGLPAKRIHPGGEKKEENCDPETLQQLEKYMSDAKKKSTDNEDKPADSRWDALKNLKFN